MNWKMFSSRLKIDWSVVGIYPSSPCKCMISNKIWTGTLVLARSLKDEAQLVNTCVATFLKIPSSFSTKCRKLFQLHDSEGENVFESFNAKKEDHNYFAGTRFLWDIFDLTIYNKKVSKIFWGRIEVIYLQRPLKAPQRSKTGIGWKRPFSFGEFNEQYHIKTLESFILNRMKLTT